jgi:CubicO group peptidase (beta-lactamase class C family)
MKSSCCVLLIGILILSALPFSQARADEVKDLQIEIPRVMKEAHVPGLQIAVIRDGKIVWHQGFGVKNATTGTPVTDETIFEAASLTKPLFAYYIMKLVDQGVIDLDKPIVGYLSKEFLESALGHPLDQPGFHREWLEKITTRHVLSHSGGLPHGEGGIPYPLFFEPGTKWKYSATGYEVLQKIVEDLKGDKLDNLMQKEVLDPLGMTRSCMVWREDYEKNMANGHSFFDKPDDFRKRTEAISSATLYTTAEDYAKFVCAVMNGTGLKPETWKEMLTSQIDMNKEKGLGWSLGFGTQDDAMGRAIWQWGDYGVFRNYIIAYPKEKTGVVYLTNSHNGLSICSYVVAHSIGAQAAGCRELNYRPFDGLCYRLAWALKEGGPKAMEKLPELKAKYPGELSPEDTEYLDYVLREDGLQAEATAVLEYNLALHPESGTARLALARAYIDSGSLDLARTQLESARKAVVDTVSEGVVDWNMDYIRAMSGAFKSDENDLKKYAGDYGLRHFQVKDGALHYLRDGGRFADYRELVPLSRDTFFIKGMSSFRMTFELDGNGNAVKVVGIYEQGGRDETPRSK